MARIVGIDLPNDKRVEVGLTYIHGIGRSRSRKILESAGISLDTKVRDLSEEEVTRVRQIIEEQSGVEGDLRKEVAMNIKRLMEISSYRGLRHRRSLPARGNGHTPTVAPARAPRRGAVAGRKKSTAKT